MNAFEDRQEAGRRLAEYLTGYRGRDDVVVLGLPRGGVPVAAEVAALLEAPLDVFVVRKLGVPGREELAMGAIASGGVRVLNENVVQALGIPPTDLEAVTTRERARLEAQERSFRENREALSVEGRTVILVDDGLATGATMRAAVRAVRERGPADIVVAVPTASRDAVDLLADVADHVIAVLTPHDFGGVSAWYRDFSQVSDDTVRSLLLGV
jgi:predicted phosphoribosyltransferase